MEKEVITFEFNKCHFLYAFATAEAPSQICYIQLQSVLKDREERLSEKIPLIKVSGNYATKTLSITKTSTTETCETGAFIEESGVEISENLTFRKTSTAEAYRNVTFSETAAIKRSVIVPVFQASTAEMNTTDEVLKPSGIYSFKISDYDKNKESFTK